MSAEEKDLLAAIGVKLVHMEPILQLTTVLTIAQQIAYNKIRNQYRLAYIVQQVDESMMWLATADTAYGKRSNAASGWRSEQSVLAYRLAESASHLGAMLTTLED